MGDTFRCWSDDFCESEADGRDIRAHWPIDAAEEYAEAMHNNGDGFESLDVNVRKPDGAVLRVHVTVDWSPTFYGHTEEPDNDP